MIRIQYKLRRLSASVCFCAMASMMFAFVFDLGPKTCDCSVKVATLSTTSCCAGSLAATGCCTKKVAKASPCCCSPEAIACPCLGCSCGEAQDLPDPTKSTLPSQQSVEFVLVGVVGSSAQFAPAWSEDDSSHSNLEHQREDMPSSRQKCVILSRFNC